MQLSFIEKLYTNQLPFKKENQEFVRRIIIQKRTNDSVFSGKTGSSYKDGKYRLGWFVGHIKKDNDEYVFVINSQGEGEAGHKLKKVAQKILSKMKI